MEDKSKFDELLISYLSDELDAEDEEFVIKWINHNDQNRQYFERLHTIWKLTNIRHGISSIDIDHEWKHFNQAINNKRHENDLFERVTNLADETVKVEDRKNKRLHYISFISAAVAVCALILIGIISILPVYNRDGLASAPEKSGKSGSVPVFTCYERNTGAASRKLLLNDGSEITLFTNSDISYPDPFTGNKRTVSLHGKASFDVAKDKTRPFTVYSGDLSVTALGTRFNVTAFPDKNKIVVKLYVGKVVVKPVEGSKSKLTHDYYLLPGQALVYNSLTSSAKLYRFQGSRKNIRASMGDVSLQPQETVTIPSHTGSWYMFNNQSLQQVFEQLQTMYEVKIVYSKKDVSNKYFIGRFDKTSRVEDILQQIATLNDLRVSRKENTFTISK